jgi:di/tricarboxylate transporter
MVFNVGLPELVVLLLLIVIVFGPFRLPSLRDRMIEARSRRRLAESRPWTQTEWLLVGTVVVLIAIVIGNAVMATAPRR